MIIKSAVLDIVCGITSKIPDTGLPEVAFAGKSNVGKSSLINGLMNRKALARTSAQPGKTQTINFTRSMMNLIWWIFQVMVCAGYTGRERKMGKDD